MAILSGHDDDEKAGERPAFRVHTITVKVTEDELKSFAALAERRDEKLSALARTIILKAIDDDTNPTNADPLFTELIGLRMFLANALRPVCSGEKMDPKLYESLIETVRKTQQETAGQIAKSYRKGKGI
jgi:hypothetical protein